MLHSIIMGEKLSQIVYGGTGSPDEHRTMSDKVQSMASAIYRELETMIKVHGEENVKVTILRISLKLRIYFLNCKMTHQKYHNLFCTSHGVILS